MAFKNPNQQALALQLTNPQAAITGGTPEVVAKPTRFTHSPQLKDYGLDYNSDVWKKYDRAYYYNKPNDIDAEIARLQKGLKEKPNDSYYGEKLEVLSNPNLQKYLRDNAAFQKQFNADYEEYAPTAKQAIINKILGNQELMRTRYYGKDNYREETDDLYDSINQEFAKKYGYDNSYYGDMFYPVKGGFRTGPKDLDEDPIEGPNGSRGYRSVYNRNEYLADLLRNGVITIDDLRTYLGGK